jgi:MFS family permease
MTHDFTNIQRQVANLYYSYPILDDIASYFGISHEQASLVPTCSQAGYATGIIFICSLGDLVRRRHLILLLTFITATLWIGLCVTNSFGLFLALSYLTSVTTVTPVREQKKIDGYLTQSSVYLERRLIL